MYAFLQSAPVLTRRIPSHVCGAFQPINVARRVKHVPARVQANLVPTAQKSPAQTYEAAVALGAAKSQLPAWKVFILGIVAGAYIAVGALLALSVGGAVPGVKAANPGLQKLLFGLIGLPTGLTMVCVAGGELFTGNTALIPAAVMSGRAKLGGLMNNWLWSYVGNFVGSMLVVWLVSASASLSGASAATSAAIATAKVGMSFGTAFLKGVLCNWLVCLAVYMQNGASDFIGKFAAILLPISAFVAMGFDHSVANMFLVPMGMKMGAAVTVREFLMKNLLPVTLGNVFAGVVLVAGIYSMAFGKQK